MAKIADKSTKTATAKPASSGAKSRPAGKEEPAPMVTLHKKEFVNRVLAASGRTRAEARPVIEATLEQLGLAFAKGETVTLPPFGKARVNRQRDIAGGEVLILRLRRRTTPDDKPAKAAKPAK